MAGVKFAGEEAVERIAHYVNKKLNIASTMPSTPNDEDIILYVGESTESYIQGCIYEYDETNEKWNIINSVQTVELTTAEYEALPVSVQNNGTIYFLTDGEGGGGGGTLAGLTDVNVSGVTNGQVIKYNSATHKWENDDESGGDGILPHLIVISETGSTVTATKGTTVITATETSTGHYECDVPEFGTWTIHAVLNGEDATVNLVVDTVKVYTVDDSHFHANVTVKYPSGATCNLAGQGESYYATGSPYTFTVHHAGNYTITVTYNGQTYTDTVTVTATGQTFIKKVPTPSSAPANDIDWWLWFGDVSGTFSSLGEILADSTALATLMASTDAVDYLVRCKEWITSKALVPTMTSNTAPSGEVIYSAQDNSFPAWKVFDGNNTQSSANSSFWRTGNTFASGDYIGYKFPQATIVRKFDIRNGWWDTYPVDISYKIQGSNDNSTWTDLFESVEENFAINTGIHSHSFENNTAYLYYRVRFSSFSAGSPPISYLSIATLQFYPSKESEGVTDNQSAMSYIGLNNYCADTLLANSDWLEGIGNSEYFESVLNVKVPVMTSNTTPSGEAFGEGFTVSNAWYCFDGSTSTRIELGASQKGYVAYDFTRNVKVFISDITWFSGRMSVYTIQGSNDRTTWEDISESITPSLLNDKRIFANDSDYRYYRCNMTSAISSNQSIVEMQFYGREDV